MGFVAVRDRRGKCTDSLKSWSISSDASSLDVMAKLEISKYEPNLKLHKMPKYVALFARIELVPLSSLAGTGVSSTQLYTYFRKSFFIGHLLHLLHGENHQRFVRKCPTRYEGLLEDMGSVKAMLRGEPCLSSFELSSRIVFEN